MVSVEFEKFFHLLKVCVTARTYSSLDGSPWRSISFVLLKIWLIVFDVAIFAKLFETFTDGEVKVRNKLYMMLTIQGATSLLLKNIGSIPFITEFKELLDWIKELHTERDENETVQEIIREELGNAMKYSKLFIWIYSAFHVISAVLGPIMFAYQNLILIVIPSLDPLVYPFTFWLIQGVSCLMAAIWSSTSNSCVIVIGIYLIFYVKILNRVILNMTDTEKFDNSTKIIIQTIKKHLEMIKYFNIFNETLKFMSIIQLSMSTILFLTLLSSIQVYKNDGILYLIFFTLQLELFFFCLFGEIIKSETEKIFWNLYQTRWYELSLKDQMTILVMMKISYNPFGLKAAGMYDVSLMAFVQIVKLAFSYSAILLAMTA